MKPYPFAFLVVLYTKRASSSLESRTSLNEIKANRQSMTLFLRFLRDWEREIESLELEQLPLLPPPPPFIITFFFVLFLRDLTQTFRLLCLNTVISASQQLFPFLSTSSINATTSSTKLSAEIWHWRSKPKKTNTRIRE